MKQAAIFQVVRERPPGYGGVERVAHELALEWQRHGIDVITFCLQPAGMGCDETALAVPYKVVNLPRIRFGQLLIPLPSRELLYLLNQRDALYAHLPCPAVLMLSILARLHHPKRLIRLHWHAFLQPPPGLKGLLIHLYQSLALRWAAAGVHSVITTSPILARGLEETGVAAGKIKVLPCCLGDEQEKSGFLIAAARRSQRECLCREGFRLLFIGRLDSYKRVDWLIQAFARSNASKLDIVGDGPQRAAFQKLAAASAKGSSITFHGRLDEADKQILLQQAHLLVLPADCCNEAFGIVQLEAMACGVPALALDCPRSGAAWVSRLKSVIGMQQVSSDDLVLAIDRLVDDQLLWLAACDQAGKRYGDCFARSTWQATFADQLL